MGRCIINQLQGFQQSANDTEPWQIGQTLSKKAFVNDLNQEAETSHREWNNPLQLSQTQQKRLQYEIYPFQN